MVPNSSFVVSRTAHRNNKSDYYINDRKSNFTEVTDLLKRHGIDLDNNRFLILQVWGAAGGGRGRNGTGQPAARQLAWRWQREAG